MFFDHIEQLKQQFTDQWVVVDASRPELKRFAGHNGRVKTVNMSGRALVEFDAYENIGWYDIDASYLTIVDAPVAQAASTTASPKKPAAKPAAKSAPLRCQSQPPGRWRNECRRHHGRGARWGRRCAGGQDGGADRSQEARPGKKRSRNEGALAGWSPECRRHPRGGAQPGGSVPFGSGKTGGGFHASNGGRRRCPGATRIRDSSRHRRCQSIGGHETVAHRCRCDRRHVSRNGQ